LFIKWKWRIGNGGRRIKGRRGRVLFARAIIRISPFGAY